MALRKEFEVVVAEPGLALGVLPYQSLERKIDTYGLSTFHERCAALGIAKDEHLGRPKRLANFCGTGGMVNAREDTQPALLGVFFEPVHRFLGCKRALDGDKTISADGRARKRKQRRKHEGQRGVHG